jgi:cytochrome c peroxidase
MQKSIIFSVFALLVGLIACDQNTPEPPEEVGDLVQYPYEPKAYTIKKPDHYPAVPVPADNPMTYDGVQLGRRLFYDPMLSGNNTMSCASCHLPAKSFTDGKQFSTGIDGIQGHRSSMSLMNIAYIVPHEPADTFLLFWDGRTKSLETQALLPVEDPIEMHHQWVNVVEDFKNHPEYPQLFRKAFGITDRSQITKELAAKAIAQFERILIGSGTSVYDRYLNGETSLLQDEALDGKLMFFDEGAPFGLPDAECFHCHGTGTLSGRGFFNNGLDPFDLIVDKGRENVTKNPNDRGKFRATTLMNIELTAPYMHDGRFSNLNQVIDHYLFDAHPTPYPNPNLNLLINKRQLYNSYHRTALVEFLKTLTDTAFINNPDIQSPF